MAFSKVDLARYFEQAQAQGAPEASILGSIFGLIATGIAKSKTAPIPYAPGVKPTEPVKPVMPGLVSNLVPKPVMATPPPNVTPLAPPMSSQNPINVLLGALGEGCKYNPNTKSYT